MAITITNLTSGNDTAPSPLTEATTASISPSANAVIIVSCWNQDGGLETPPQKPTVSGLSFSFTEINTRVETYDRITSWWAPTGGSPGSGTITFDTTGQDQENFSWIIDQVTGSDTSTPIVQNVAADGGDASGTSLSITLAAFSDVNNGTYGAFGGSNDTGNCTPGSGFAELADITHTDAGYGIRATEWRNDNDTSVDITYSASVRREGIAMEIKVAAAGTKIPIFMNQYRSRWN